MGRNRENENPQGAACRWVEASLWRYLDRELPGSDIARVTAHLRSCTPCRKLYEARSREAKLWTWALSGVEVGREAVPRVREAIEARGLSELYEGGIEARFGSLWERRIRVRLRWAVAAALVLLVPGLVLVGYLLSPSEPLGLGKLRVVRGEVRALANGRDSPATPEAELLGMRSVVTLRAGLELELDEGAEVLLDVAQEGEDPAAGRLAQVTIAGPARFRVGESATRLRFSGYLASGVLYARVAPLRPREAFAVETPHARAEVVGTRFRLEASEWETRLAVEEGTVKFSARAAPGEGDGGEALGPEDGVWRVLRGGRAPEPAGESEVRERQGGGEAQSEAASSGPARAEASQTLPDSGAGEPPPVRPAEASGRPPPRSLPGRDLDSPVNGAGTGERP